MLTTDERARLIQLLGMMGSNYDGEVCNAAKLAQRLLSHHKLTWGEVLNGSATTSTSNANRAAGGGRGGEAASYEKGFQAGLDRGAELAAAAIKQEYLRGYSDGVKHAKHLGIKSNRSWREWAQDRVDHDEDCLSEWEINFFGSFAAGRYAVPSDKQRAIFQRVAARLDLELPE